LYEPFVPGLSEAQSSEGFPRIDTGGRLGFLVTPEAERQAEYRKRRWLTPLDEASLAASDGLNTEEEYLLVIKNLCAGNSEQSEPRARFGASPKILWVDDHPESNEWHARALREAGCEVDQATSTEEALVMLRNKQHGLVISEVTRGGSPFGGFDLLNKLPPSSQAQTRVPVIFFTSPSRAAELREDARAKGAVACTSGTVSLFETVFQVLSASSA